MRQCSPRMCCSPRRSQPQFVVAPVMAGLEGVVGTPMWKHLRHRFEKHRDLGRHHRPRHRRVCWQRNTLQGGIMRLGCAPMPLRCSSDLRASTPTSTSSSRRSSLTPWTSTTSSLLSSDVAVFRAKPLDGVLGRGVGEVMYPKHEWSGRLGPSLSTPNVGTSCPKINPGD